MIQIKSRQTLNRTLRTAMRSVWPVTLSLLLLTGAVAQERELLTLDEDAWVTFGGSSTPEEMKAEKKRLKAIGKCWEEAIDDIRAGNRHVEKGKNNLDKVQAEVRESRSLREAGSILMRNSQRVLRGKESLSPKSRRL